MSIQAFRSLLILAEACSSEFIPTEEEETDSEDMAVNLGTDSSDVTVDPLPIGSSEHE
jgi:hypothetical protein